MDFQDIRYSVFGGVRKNLHLPYYINGLWMMAMPRSWTVRRREAILREFDRLTPHQQTYIQQRVDYYNRLEEMTSLPADARPIGEQSFLHKDTASVYVFDTYEWNRYFPAHLKWVLGPGDVTNTFNVPTITKSRPIEACKTNPNSVLINMDKVRHFMFFDDPVAFDKKQNQVIFRGAITGKANRMFLMDNFFNNPLIDIRDTAKDSTYPEEMRQHVETTIYGHLKYKYILSLEGNDVASNLKWIMNSNSIAVTPALRFETWFMEGSLKANEHYIEVKSDFSDVVERISYYNDHPNEARDIVNNAHEHCRQFFNKDMERLISLMVMDKYFRLTGQAVR